jgi:hypothetical protein
MVIRIPMPEQVSVWHGPMHTEKPKLDGEVLTIVSNNCNFIKGAEGQPLLILGKMLAPYSRIWSRFAWTLF